MSLKRMEDQTGMTELYFKSVLNAPSSSDLPGHSTAVAVVMSVLSLFIALTENLFKRKKVIQMLFPVFVPLLICHLMNTGSSKV